MTRLGRSTLLLNSKAPEQSTDWASLKWLRQRYTAYGFRFHGSLRGRETTGWQHRRHTDRWWHAISKDTCLIRYWLLHDTANIGRVTIRSNRADHPTLNLHRSDQHTPPLFLTVGLLVWQSGNIRLVSNLSYSAQPGFAMQIKRTEISNQSIFIYYKIKHARTERIPSLHMLHFSTFLVRVLCMTGWKCTGLKHRYRYRAIQPH